MRRWLAVLALLVTGSIPLQQDLPGALRVRPGFTLFAVGLAGEEHPIAHFDGLRWQAACSPDIDAAGTLRPVVGIRGSFGAPLRTVRVVNSSDTSWQASLSGVEQVARRMAGDIPAMKPTELTIYSVDGAALPTVFVDLVLRSSDARWRGVSAAGWVRVDTEGRAVVAGPMVTRFDTYDEYLRIGRYSPLGVAETGDPDARTWVMRERLPDGERVQMFDVASGAAMVGPRTPGGGC